VEVLSGRGRITHANGKMYSERSQYTQVTTMTLGKEWHKMHGLNSISAMIMEHGMTRNDTHMIITRSQ